ncbi:His Kinase A (phospho-acceptor) domain-containing protein [Clostridium sp. DSM 8431]|uniref:sensor histidine kinase n=1 Tax=Clostridium sp. DSM 8431 TaxID=1761781 RepID=UPI0008E50E50|nr:ATP-binding protein [Clostridium sp. DSM 8431]SFU30184.1 His Kinase A (phospho-acceptor) domain-containing protein [Clostridium sp. DSM 8431]
MFKKLKRKFIAVGMILITSIILLICTAIYISTKSNSEYMIFSQLKDSLNDIRVGDPVVKGHYKDTMLIVYDTKTSTIAYANEGSLDESYVRNIISSVLEKKKPQGFIEENDYNLAYVYKTSPVGVEIALKDSGMYKKTIRKLVISEIIIAGVGIFLSYLISLYVANKAVKPVEEAYNSQKRFIADASHELKTPLAVVKTNVEILKANKSETIESQEKWINYISFQTDRMSKLVNDLLYLAKADNNEVLGVQSKFDISEAILDQMLSFEAVIYENELGLDYDIQDNIMFYGNKEGINQLVGILVDNAIKHSYKNKDIKVSLKEDKGIIRFSVTNYGDNIPKEELDKIFERFYRVDKSRSKEKGGYGLGLSIAKTIVSKENGNIRAFSDNNVINLVVELNSPSINKN